MGVDLAKYEEERRLARERYELTIQEERERELAHMSGERRQFEIELHESRSKKFRDLEKIRDEERKKVKKEHKEIEEILRFVFDVLRVSIKQG